VWLFSSGPLGPPEALKPEGDPVDVAAFVEAVVVAVRAPEGDFRDWEAIDGYAGEIAVENRSQNT
jgi:menaquinone-dependent protoporphyrinogen oxidase